MSFSASIKISELDTFPLPVVITDFIPVVKSSSMTTYRANVGDLIPSPLQYVSGSVYASSSILASQSIQSTYATYSKHVNLTGSEYYYPFWFSDKTLDGGAFEVNGCLKGIPTPYGSQLFNYVGGSPDITQNVIVAGPYRIFLSPTQYTTGTAGPGTRTDYYISSSWNPWANTLEGQMGYGAMGGIWSSFPIISPMFVGTDQMSWNFATASYSGVAVYSNQFWSGSSISGTLDPTNLGWQTIPGGSGITNGISASFNKKWVRIVSNGYIYPTVTDGASKGEVSSWDNLGLFGRIKLWVHTGLPLTSLAQGSSQMIDMHIDDHVWSGGISATVHSAVEYGVNIIKKIRLSKWNSGSLQKDPQWAMDLFLDGIEDELQTFSIMAQSWGGIKFLQVLNVDPDPLVNTGSADIHNSEMLIFPPAAGHYGTYTNRQNYFLQGHNVVINPTYNEMTESFGVGNPLFSTHSLNVSGTINATEKFSCGDLPGQSGIFSVYNPATSNWNDVSYHGGIFVSASSIAAIVPGDTLPIGTIIAIAYSSSIPNNYLECNGALVSTGSYLALYNAIKTTDPTAAFGQLCDQFGTPSLSGDRVKLPDLRAEFVRGWDHSRGVDINRAFGTSQSDTIKAHTHSIALLTDLTPTSTTGQYIHKSSGLVGSATTYLSSSMYGSTETRPRNISLVYVIKYSNATNYGDLTGHTLAGDCVGTYNSTSVVKIQNIPVTESAPVTGQVMTFNGTKWIPSSPSSIPPDMVKAYGSFYYDATSSIGTPNYRKNVMNPGAFNMKTTASYDAAGLSSSFYFDVPLSTNTYAVIMTTDALVGTIDHGNPFQILNQTTDSFLVKFEQSIIGSSTGAARSPNVRLTQGSFLVVSSL